MKALTTLLVVGMFATAVAMADDVDDVKAAMGRYFAALNAGDTETVYQYRIAARDFFAPGGGLLSTSTSSLEEQKKSFQNQVNAGRKRNFRLRHMEVKVYGNTAIVTSYMVGTSVSPNGTTTQITGRRRTGVMIKQGGQWKEAHYHQSPLAGGQ